MKQTELFSTGCFNTSPPRSVLVRPRLCIRLSLVDCVTPLGLGFRVRGLSITEEATTCCPDMMYAISLPRASIPFVTQGIVRQGRNEKGINPHTTYDSGKTKQIEARVLYIVYCQSRNLLSPGMDMHWHVDALGSKSKGGGYPFNGAHSL